MLVKVIMAPPPFPSPARPYRNRVSRCLVQIYQSGESRTLYDTLQTFLKIAGDAKALDRDVHKMQVRVLRS
jgi:HEAT repeat-containing protein 5